MTQKEKAQELVNKFLKSNEGHFYQVNEVADLEAAKESALIAIHEIIEALKDNAANSASWQYYEEVKQEVEKL